MKTRRWLVLFATLFCASAHAQNTLFPANPGDMIVKGGAGAWVPVPGGTAGCVLTSNGPAAAPTWQCALALNFLLPPMATNKVWGNVSGGSAAATQIDVNQFLNTIDYDIQRPPLPGSVPYKGTDNKWHTAPPPAPVGWVWTAQGTGQIPQWSSPFMFGAPIPYSVLAAGADANPVFSTSFGLGGPLIGGSISTQGTGTNSVIVSKQTDGATSTTGVSGFEAWSDVSDLFLIANGTARTTVRYGVTTGGYGEITADTGNGLLLGTLNNTPVILGANNAPRMTLSAAGVSTPSGVSLGVGGAPVSGESISAYNGNIVARGNNTIEMYAQQVDGATSTTGAAVMGAIANNGFPVTVDGSLVANGLANTKTRWGLSAIGGYVEAAAFLGNGLIVGTQPAVPLIFGTNNLERGRIDAAGAWTIPGSLAIGGALISGTLSTQGTGISSVIASRQTDGASSTTGTAGFEGYSDLADIFLTANGTARTATRYGVPIGGYSEITSPTGNGILIGTLNNTPVIIGNNNTERLRISSASIAVPAGLTLALGGAPIGGEAISAYNANIVVRGNGAPEMYASQLDGDTSTLGQSVMGAVSGGGGAITVDGSLVANGFANTKVRYGLTLGGYVELSAFLGNGLIVGTWINTPFIFGANNIERGRISPTTGEWVIGPGGATVPSLSSTLHVTAADSTQTVLGVDAFGAIPFLTFRRSNGSKAAPTAVQNGDAIGSLSFQGRGATTYSGSRVEIDAFATENWTDAAQGVRLDFYTTPTGTIVPNLALRLAAGLGVGTTSDPGAGLIYLNSASFLMRNKTSWSNGAAAQTATLTNAPAAGIPTKWVPIDDNGTTRYIPTW